MKKKLLISIAVLFCLVSFSYLFLLPNFVNNENCIAFVENIISKQLNCELKIIKPYLKTSIKPNISFKVEEISLKNKEQKILLVDDFNISLSFSKLYKKIITLNNFELCSFYLNTDELNKIIKPSNNKKKQTKTNLNLDWINAHLVIKDFQILSSIDNGVKINIKGNNLEIEEKRNPKYVRFHINTILSRKNETIKISLDDNDRFYINNKQLIIKDGLLDLNNSRIFINSLAQEGKISISLNSKKFKIADLVNIIKSNILIPNGKELLAEIEDIKGDTDFKLTLNKSGIYGDISVKPTTFKIKSLNKLPIKIEKGSISINPKSVCLKDFVGYYGTNKNGNFKLTGDIADYLKIAKANLEIITVVTNDLTKNYLSKVVGIDLKIVGDDTSPARIAISTIGEEVNITCASKIAAGNDLLVEDMSFSPKDYDRALRIDMILKDNILNLENIKYFIAKDINAVSKTIKPILTFSGNFDLKQNGKILDLSFEIPKPLPSEFLNLFAGAKTFQKGLISGKIKYLDNNNFPKISGSLELNETIIPKAKLYLKKCALNTDNNHINIIANGKYRKGNYNLTGKIENKLLLPIVVPQINFDIDYVDIEKLLNSLVMEENTSNNVKPVSNVENLENDENSAIAFQPNLIEIKDAKLDIKKGKYKELEFDNFVGNAKLDRKGILTAQSNVFDFAQGKSKAELNCDLVKNKFWIKLIGEMVDSDALATSLLNLKKEITGKACGLIVLETDETLKLNGSMDFLIVDGTIEKVGYIEYALNFVSLFRNSLSMLSPSTLIDIVNIPEGKFDRIKGNIIIKNNIITSMKIQSSASQLVTLILGWMNLETYDSSLRIYTKFASENKGVAGLLRKVSLHSLANRFSFGESSKKKYYTSELNMLPKLKTNEEDSQIYLTTVDGDVINFNFLSSLKRIK